MRGFTLIELLVVLAILALVGITIALNAPPPRRDSQIEAERFAARLATAMNESISNGTPIRVDVSSDGYSFQERTSSGWRQVTGVRPLAARTLDSHVAIEIVSYDPARLNAKPGGASQDRDESFHLILDPIGAMDSATFLFHDGRHGWRVVMNAAGKVSVEANAR